MIFCPTPPQMIELCDLIGTVDAPISKIASINVYISRKMSRNHVSINLIRPLPSLSIFCQEGSSSTQAKVHTLAGHAVGPFLYFFLFCVLCQNGG